MTLKDLFMQVRFDDLIPSLLEQDENTQNSICSFREAFDLLRYLPAYRIFPVPYLRLFIQHIIDTFQAG